MRTGPDQFLARKPWPKLNTRQEAHLVGLIAAGEHSTAEVADLFGVSRLTVYRVYLVANTVMNVTTQEEQLQVFANASAHLQPGGCFVVEVIVPQLRSVPRGELGRIFALDDDHVGLETFDDLVGQVAWSHHWMQVAGRLVKHSAPYRYVWPSELVLMAKLTGFRLRDR